MNTIACKIKDLRTEKNWTQERLAQELYVTRQAVSKWEQGKSIPDIASLKAIAALFEVTVDELLDDGACKMINVESGREMKKVKKNQWIALAVSCVLLMGLIVTSAFSIWSAVALKKAEEKVNVGGFEVEIREIKIMIGYYIVKNLGAADLSNPSNEDAYFYRNPFTGKVWQNKIVLDANQTTVNNDSTLYSEIELSLPSITAEEARDSYRLYTVYYYKGALKAESPFDFSIGPYVDWRFSNRENELTNASSNKTGSVYTLTVKRALKQNETGNIVPSAMNFQTNN